MFVLSIVLNVLLKVIDHVQCVYNVNILSTVCRNCQIDYQQYLSCQYTIHSKLKLSIINQQCITC